MSGRISFTAVYETLLAEYGPQGWWPADSPFEVMVGAVLIQRTQWPNAARVVDALRDVGLLTPDALAVVKPEALHDLVRGAGFYRQKSSRLTDIAKWFLRQGGPRGIAWLSDGALRDALLGLNGIGEETADAIMLYAFKRPRFVVDAYARRLFSQLGLLEEKMPRATLLHTVECALSDEVDLLNEYHALIVAHAKARCRARPRCRQCCLSQWCEFDLDDGADSD